MVVALVSLLPAGALAQSDGARNDWKKQAKEAIASRDWLAARSALNEVLKDTPGDPKAHYDLSVAMAQLGESSDAAQQLVLAVRDGFIDFHQLERDSRLRPIRSAPQYRAIISGWRELLDARADVNEKALRSLFGGAYHYQRDPTLRLIFASAFNEQSFAVAEQEIDAVASWAFANLFDPPAADDPKPDAWVTVLLPTPEHFLKYMLALGAGPNVGGLYDNDRSQLICQDIGPSLRHEFLHVLQWRQMTRLGQRPPDWIMEGLGALVEDMDADAEAPGGYRPVANWRTNIAKRLLKLGRLMPLDDLMKMDRKVFRGRRPNAKYAQARAFMLFLSEQNKLSDFVSMYQSHFAQDATGRSAVEGAMGESLVEIQSSYRSWLDELPMVPEKIEPGKASLGVVVAAGRGDGPVIDHLVPGAPASRSGLRRGDVILSVDGRSTRTLPELVRVLSGYDAGRVVRVDVRRGRRVRTIEVELTER